MEFKERIKELRKEKKMTIVQLALLMDKTEAAVRAWESGRTKPDLDIVLRLAQYFGCTTDYLLGVEDRKTSAEKRRLDKIWDRIFARLEDLPQVDRTFLSDIFLKILSIMEDLRDAEEVKTVFTSFFYRLYLDIAMGGALMAQFSRQNSMDAAKMKLLLKHISDLSIVDHQALWAEWEKAVSLYAEERDGS
jgi:transcriptional regulator with XRE-family HTH domain